MCTFPQIEDTSCPWLYGLYKLLSIPLPPTTDDCRTRNVVYLIECAKCSIQYIGETENALRVRLTGHRSDISHHRLDRPVALHFNQPHHSLKDLTIMVIEKIYREDAQLRRQKERYWIETIKTLSLNGLNRHS